MKILEFFHDADDTGYAHIETDGQSETLEIASDIFKRRITRQFIQRRGEPPKPAELKAEIESARIAALDPSSPVRKVFKRTASADGCIYIDLADADGNVVEIRSNGWEIIQNPPVRFIRTPSMMSMPMPVTGGSIEALRPFVNVKDDEHFVLLMAWTLNAMAHRDQQPVLLLKGAPGTAKSTLLEIIASIVDPNSETLRGFPRSETELLRLRRSRYLIGADNSGELSSAMSNATCRHSDGGAHPVVINGIGAVVKMPDLIDRSVFITCESIFDEARLSKEKLWREFQDALPKLLGALIEALVHGLKNLQHVRHDRLPRLADFARWAAACEGAIWPEGTFAAAYRANINDAAEQALEADLVASAVRRLMENKSKWTGNATELDGYLRAKTGIAGVTPPGWPPDPARLSARLRALAPSLSKVGILVTFVRDGNKRTRLINISTRSGTDTLTKQDAGGLGAAKTPCAEPSAPSAESPDKTTEDAIELIDSDSSVDAIDPITAPNGTDGADGADGADGQKQATVPHRPASYPAVNRPLRRIPQASKQNK